MTWRYFFAALIIAATMALAFILPSCGGGDPQVSSAGNPILSDIEGASAPAGTDPAVFEGLKNELKRQLENRMADGERIAAKAPSGDAGRVTDLAYNLGTNRLSWSYVNQGDYDCNGEVGISDITPIALHYLADADDGSGDDALESWIDGDNSGEVAIGDITPIALGYLSSVARYDILTCATELGEYTPIGQVSFPSPSSFPVLFDIDLPAGALGWVRVQPVDAGNYGGEQSNAVQVNAPNQPPVADFTDEQQSGYTVQFDMINSYDHDGVVTLWEYDWESDGTYDYSDNMSRYATHDYGASGQWDCTLRVTDNDAETGTITKTVYVIELATDWTIVDPFPASTEYSLPAAAYIGTAETGNPGIVAYGNFESGYVTATDGYGGAWSSVTAIDTYVVNSLALADIHGYPAIAFNDYTDDQLNYCRATIPDGSAWGSFVIVDSRTGSGRSYLKMTLVDPYPAIAYYHNGEDNGTVSYVHASDLTGDIWQSPVQLHAAPPAGTYISIGFVYYTPAVAYTNMSPVNPMYIKSLDNTGESWGTEVQANADGGGSGWTSLVALNVDPQLPGIVGCSNGGNAILFYRAADPWGTAWDAPITITGDTNLILGHVSAAIVNGFPCVAYQEYNLTSLEKALVFKQALTPDGSLWSDAIYVDIIAAEDVTLLDVRGRPAICYYEQVNDATHWAFSPAN